MTTPTPALIDTSILPGTLNPLFTEAQLRERILEIATQINQDYVHTECLVLVCILKGGFMFLTELAKSLTIPCHIEFVRLSSYGDAQKSSGTVKPVDLTLPRLTGKDVLIVDDIVDTGLTLNFFIDYLASLHTPKSLKLAVLLDKVATRQQPVKTDYVGFEIDDQFVVGYGLDYEGFYRNLPYIGYLQS